MAFRALLETVALPGLVRFEDWQIWQSKIFRSLDTFSYLFNAPIRTKGVATKSYATLSSTKQCYFRIKFVHKVWCKCDVVLRPSIRSTLLKPLLTPLFTQCLSFVPCFQFEMLISFDFMWITNGYTNLRSRIILKMNLFDFKCIIWQTRHAYFFNIIFVGKKSFLTSRL